MLKNQEFNTLMNLLNRVHSEEMLYNKEMNREELYMLEQILEKCKDILIDKDYSVQKPLDEYEEKGYPPIPED